MAKEKILRMFLDEERNGQTTTTVFKSEEELLKAFDASKADIVMYKYTDNHMNTYCLKYKDAKYSFQVGQDVRIKKEFLGEHEDPNTIYQVYMIAWGEYGYIEIYKEGVTVFGHINRVGFEMIEAV